MSYEVLCCICGKCCGPISDWVDADGLPGHILRNGYECKECEEDHRENLQLENES